MVPLPLPRASADTRTVCVPDSRDVGPLAVVAAATGWHVLVVTRRGEELDVLLARG